MDEKDKWKAFFETGGNCLFCPEKRCPRAGIEGYVFEACPYRYTSWVEDDEDYDDEWDEL